jgi:AmmeMemoRadiSam system protein B
MKNKTKKIIFLPVMILFVAGFWLIFVKIDIGKKVVIQEKSNYFFNISVDYNWQIFTGAIGTYPKSTNSSIGEIKGIIVPHHDLAGKYVAEIMQKIADDKIERVIIVGPNHAESGVNDIVSGIIQWQTPQGEIKADIKTIKFLQEKGLVYLAEEKFKTEHSINAMVPYIHYYFPNAKIVPIILKHGTSLTETEKLAIDLKDLMNEKTLIIGSIDFSHYLPTAEAYDKDKITAEALKNSDYEKLYSFDNDYLDSPPTAVTVLKVMDLLKASNLTIVRNTNQADAVGLPTIKSSTSYFTILLGG